MPQHKLKGGSPRTGDKSLESRRENLLSMARSCDLAEVLEIHCFSAYCAPINELSIEQIDEVEETVLAMVAFVSRPRPRGGGTVH